MSEQLLNGLEPDYCGGACDSGFCNIDNTPLQEQVEQQDKHIFSLEDALEKTVDVIAALMGERKDLHDQLYQAQVDAQDWQNQYRSLVANYEGLQRQLATLRDERDAWKVKCSLAGRACDAEQIRELTNEVQDLRNALEVTGEEGSEIIGELTRRIQELTDQNTQLEVRNERQALRQARIRRVLDGDWDDHLLFVKDKND